MTCNDFGQSLALGAAGCLEADRLNEVRAHCDTCAGCAARLEQFRVVAAAHSTAATELDGLALRRNNPATPQGQRVMSPDRFPSNLIGRWLLPIGAVAAVALGFFVREQMAHPTLPPTDSRRAAIPPGNSVDQAPTLAAYRRSVDRTGDASFDALLARDADRLLRGGPRENLRSLLDESF